MAKVKILKNPSEIAQTIAKRIQQVIQEKNAQGKYAVLVLPTGSTPITIYRELVKLHKAGELSFEKVITFNLDEYYPMKPDSIHSYHRFMNENLFNHIDIKKENIHIPRGDLPIDQTESFCKEYERLIKEHGGVDMCLLGVGRNGHIAFNEPGSTNNDRTRVVLLDYRTRKDAASSFFGEQHVPVRAVTMGIATILESREIILVATGENKAKVAFMALEQKWANPSDCPASYLRSHENCTFYFDEPAAAYLSHLKTPWVYNANFQWTETAIKKAVLHAAKASNKSIFELSAVDFHEQKLTSLLVETKENVDSLCARVFRDIMSKISVFEGEKGLVPCKQGERVLIFSPHPDDDVICMGGLMQQFVRCKVDTRVAYMTNGSVAVDDDILRDHLRFANFSASSSLKFETEHNIEEVLHLITDKAEGGLDHLLIQRLKANVRKAEAINAVEVLGLHEKDTYFLDLPFYKTGDVVKKPIGKDDVDIVLHLLEEVQPHHIYVAGDLTDPHGTHRMCYFAIRAAVEQYRQKTSNTPFQIWLYRGAWQEWEVEETSVFVPLSRAEMEFKINSIFKHQSQKDRALFPGNDVREFWQRARDRNTNNALVMSQLGFPKFFAIEAFVIVDEMPI